MSNPSSITQIPGIYAAHATDEKGATGCTVILCPDGAIGAVDVRGGAPATRETDLLRPEETVSCVHAVVLSGGSAYGLAASCGVAEELERHGIGLEVGAVRVPIVVGACLFDLACGDPQARPDVVMGAEATAEALTTPEVPLIRGNVGAGTGATVGKLAGAARAMKGGLGEAVETAGELICGAVVGVNACGDIVDPVTKTLLAGMRNTDGTGLTSSEEALITGEALLPLARTNTTISCVVTNACLTKAQATKVAHMAADAYAHAICPTHTTNDGDTVFVLATGSVNASVDVVGALSIRALERAIVDGVEQARTAYGFPARCDLGR